MVDLAHIEASGSSYGRAANFPRRYEMNLKAGLIAAIVGTGAVCVGCGGEVQEVRNASGEEAPATRSAETAQLATAEFSVEGMTCGGCAIATEMSVKKLEGVSSADASYDEETGEGRATVEYDADLVGTDAIAEAIRGAGFEPTLRTESAES
jgi:copper chaperone CopZ